MPSFHCLLNCIDFMPKSDEAIPSLCLKFKENIAVRQGQLIGCKSSTNYDSYVVFVWKEGIIAQIVEEMPSQHSSSPMSTWYREYFQIGAPDRITFLSSQESKNMGEMSPLPLHPQPKNIDIRLYILITLHPSLSPEQTPWYYLSKNNKFCFGIQTISQWSTRDMLIISVREWIIDSYIFVKSTTVQTT